MSHHPKNNGHKNDKRKRTASNEDKEIFSKKSKSDMAAIVGNINLNKSRIYNYGYVKKPAELFRKDLISAMKMADHEQLSNDDYIFITDHWKEEWEKGVQVPVNPESLPEPKYCCIDNDKPESSSEDSLDNKPLFQIQSTDADLFGNYELDLLDLCWLQSLKESEETVPISEKFFESVMNELEHQCARNMKAKHVGIEYDDHIICEVCRSPDAEDGNEMVFCDSCNICVHQACYGITVIPEGEWLCSPCKELGYVTDSECVLCPSTGGALKPTTTAGEWAHVSCALWVPEVNIGCVKLMEPITKIKQISQTRWNLLCSLCKIKKGAPIQCAASSCKVAYHVTCAFNSKLKMKAIAVDDKKVRLKSYCHKHSNLADVKDDRDGVNFQSKINGSPTNSHEFEIAQRAEFDEKFTDFWKYIDINQLHTELGPIFHQENSSTSLAPSHHFSLYLDLIFQYWKLKRESNYGSPLIKMISCVSEDLLKLQQHAGILRFRVDLERIRNLSYMVCRREKIKCNWLRTHQETVEKVLQTTGVDLPTTSEAENDEKESSQTKIPSSGIPSKKPSPPISQAKLQLVKSIIGASGIYQDKSTEKPSPKILAKQLRRIMKQENPDKFKKHRVNPYAKFYLQRRTNGESDCSDIADSGKKKSGLNGKQLKQSSLLPVFNRFPTSNSPLKNKSSVDLSQSSPANKKDINENNNQQTVNGDVTSNSIITRASALIGYKIPKKKRNNADQEKIVENDRIRKVDPNFTISPLKSSHIEQRVSDSPTSESNNHHYLRKPSLMNTFKSHERHFDRRRRPHIY